MTIKLLGCLILLGTGGFAAYRTADHEKKKLSVTEGWLELLFYIRTRIDCHLAPIEQIFKEASPTLLHACMGQEEDRTPSQLLEHSRIYLEEDAAHLLDSFSREIGTCYREEQVKRCDYYITALRKIRDRQITELPARLKTRGAMCICGTIGLAILLW
jgi:hypothetical protein